MRRREFIGLGVGGVAVVSLGAAFWDDLFGSAQRRPLRRGPGYGPLRPPDENGVRLATGFRSRLVVRGGEPVSDTGYEWHIASDGMAAFRLDDGGFVLVSDSENFKGGASALRFGSGGQVEDAYSILSGTTQNCSGGGTPWGTWLSCEEVEDGRVWECDPSGRRKAVPHPAMGIFKHEAAAVDERRRRVYLTEDLIDGGLYRYTPTRWPDLAAGLLEIARVARGGGVVWVEVPDPLARRTPARRQVRGSTRFQRGEGIWLDGDTLYVSTTSDHRVHAYDVRRGRIEVIYDGLASRSAPLLRVDQLTGSRAGEVFVCEDIATDEIDMRLITPDRKVSKFLSVTSEAPQLRADRSDLRPLRHADVLLLAARLPEERPGAWPGGDLRDHGAVQGRRRSSCLINPHRRRHPGGGTLDEPNQRMDAESMTITTETGVRVLDNYVGGRWTGSSSSETLPVTNPATGEILARVPLSSSADLDAAVRAARDALPAWRAVSVIERGRKLFALRQALDSRREELARSVTTEMGKTLGDARAEVARMIEMVECACAVPTTMQGRILEDVARNVDAETVRQPVGVCAAIVPFNFPAMVPFWFLPFAIACGNSFILKPSEQVPLTQQIAFEELDRLDLPPGVVNLVNGGREVVEGILDHPGIDAVSFVGSAPVARIVYERAAKAGKRVQALGGAKNHMVVMPDAVIDKTVSGIIGSAFGAAGQRCMAGSVVVTVGEAHDRLLPSLRGATERLTVGDGLAERTDVGPVISKRACERIRDAIDRAAHDGAEPVVDGRDPGGELPGGAYVGPTILDGVTPDMEAAREEIFGPVLSIIHANSLDEAIEIVGRSRFGNGVSIFTESGAAVRRFRHEVQAGMVGVNIGVAAPVAFFPFSGWKDSFLGDLHAHGSDAVDFYTRKKTITSRWFSSGQGSGSYFIES